MLIPYVAKYEKVVMGLLSYLAPYRALEDLTLEMKRIKSNQRQVYLWRDEETDNVIAIIGFDLDSENKAILVRYLSINPSFQAEDISFSCLSALAKEFPMYGISGTLEMSECLKKRALHEQRTISEIIGLDVKKNEGQHG